MFDWRDLAKDGYAARFEAFLKYNKPPERYKSPKYYLGFGDTRGVLLLYGAIFGSCAAAAALLTGLICYFN
jgi:hypothetical protein